MPTNHLQKGILALDYRISFMCEQIQQCFLFHFTILVLDDIKSDFSKLTRCCLNSLLISGDCSRLLKSYTLEHNNLEIQITSHF